MCVRGFLFIVDISLLFYKVMLPSFLKNLNEEMARAVGGGGEDPQSKLLEEEIQAPWFLKVFSYQIHVVLKLTSH